MRWVVLSLLVGSLAVMGCSSGGGSDGTGGQGGSGGADLEWPPDATVYFDEYGIFHGDCATDEDCAMALGYYHAFDRFVQMDIRRRFSTGRLADFLDPGIAQLLGVAEVAADARALFRRARGSPPKSFSTSSRRPKPKPCSTPMPWASTNGSQTCATVRTTQPSRAS
jgi:acyl-homoserine lactone acylase PvdQ